MVSLQLIMSRPLLSVTKYIEEVLVEVHFHQEIVNSQNWSFSWKCVDLDLFLSHNFSFESFKSGYKKRGV